MYGYSIVKWLFFFYFYCFFGWCFESTYVSLKQKRWVNRGFMRGPFLPLYGSGAIMMLIVSMPFRGNVVLIYLAGCVGATVLEYVTGVAMEAMFKVRYWDYSGQKFNFQGHICLTSTLAWGFLTILMTEHVHMWVEQAVFMIPYNLLTVLTFILTFGIAADFALSFKAAMDLKDVLIRMERAKEELVHIKRRLDVIIAFANEDFANYREELADSFNAKKEAVAENINARMDIFTENMELRMDDLKSGIEDGISRVREYTIEKPEAYFNSIKTEYQEIKNRYRKNLDERTRLASLKDFFQKSMLRANPSMTSGRFREALEELKNKNAEDGQNQDK